MKKDIKNQEKNSKKKINPPMIRKNVNRRPKSTMSWIKPFQPVIRLHIQNPKTILINERKNSVILLFTKFCNSEK